MDDAYTRLAETLDKIPNGYPHTQDGTHLRVLEWIFTPEEADLASRMKLSGETSEEMAGRLKIPVKELVRRLESMVKKGQIQAWDSRKGRKYGLIPFVVGIYENQVKRLDSTSARLMEDYFRKGSGSGLFSAEPPIMRVVPVNRAINAELEIYPYESAEEIIKSAKSWGIRDCICKTERALVGSPCKFKKAVCIALWPNKENAFDGDELTRAVSMEEALHVLREAEDAGLVHCAMNVQTRHNYICNCCTCCCGVLRALEQYKQPNALVRSHYFANVDEELCSGCGTCNDRCQFHALSSDSGVCTVNKDRCIGCGVCTIVCPEGALTLKPKPESERSEPPGTIVDWMTQRAISRGVDPSDIL